MSERESAHVSVSLPDGHTLPERTPATACDTFCPPKPKFSSRPAGPGKEADQHHRVRVAVDLFQIQRRTRIHQNDQPSAVFPEVAEQFGFLRRNGQVAPVPALIFRAAPLPDANDGHIRRLCPAEEVTDRLPDRLTDDGLCVGRRHALRTQRLIQRDERAVGNHGTAPAAERIIRGRISRHQGIARQRQHAAVFQQYNGILLDTL